MAAVRRLAVVNGALRDGGGAGCCCALYSVCCVHLGPVTSALMGLAAVPSYRAFAKWFSGVFA